jgi:formylglycine-generating enzyme required for sulfatase activity
MSIKSTSFFLNCYVSIFPRKDSFRHAVEYFLWREDFMFCQVCGTKSADGALFCSKCGKSLFEGSGASAPAVMQRLDAGTLLDRRYEVLSLVSQGGFGRVYKARDNRFAANVAIKEMTGSFDSDEERAAMERYFQQEAQVLFGLKHPSLPTVSDYFFEMHRFFLVMEYIEGMSLRAVIDRSRGAAPFDEGMAFSWFLSLLEIMEYIHGQNPPIIHRDIKPDNLIWQVDRKILYLVDFGIVRVGCATKTMSYGTPGYASPEQASGKATPSVDIFGAGATLYHLLTGDDPADHPFDFEPLRSARPDMATAFADAIDIMVSLRARERFQSVPEIRSFLASHGGHIGPAFAKNQQPPSASNGLSAPISQSAPAAVQSGSPVSSQAASPAVSQGASAAASQNVPAMQSASPAALQGSPQAASQITPPGASQSTPPSASQIAPPGASQSVLPTAPQIAPPAASQALPAADSHGAPAPVQREPAGIRADSDDEQYTGSITARMGEPAAGVQDHISVPHHPEVPPVVISPPVTPEPPPAPASPPSRPMTPLSPAELPAGVTFIDVNPQGFEEYQNDIDNASLIWIPPGYSQMGAARDDREAKADEKPIHRVLLSGYWIYQYQVTNRQFALFAHATGCTAAPEWEEYWEKSGDHCPVVFITFNDAMAYCRWAHAMLPTEAQWEKAARGDDERTYPWGSFLDNSRFNCWDSPALPGRADFFDGRGPVKVGTCRGGDSPFGVADMAGNVWEWCLDTYEENYYEKSPERDPRCFRERSTLKAMRGGSWNEIPRNCRVTKRMKADAGSAARDRGFRCVIPAKTF